MSTNRWYNNIVDRRRMLFTSYFGCVVRQRIVQMCNMNTSNKTSRHCSTLESRIILLWRQRGERFMACTSTHSVHYLCDNSFESYCILFKFPRNDWNGECHDTVSFISSSSFRCERCQNFCLTEWMKFQTKIRHLIAQHHSDYRHEVHSLISIDGIQCSSWAPSASFLNRWHMPFRICMYIFVCIGKNKYNMCNEKLACWFQFSFWWKRLHEILSRAKLKKKMK